MRRKMFLMLVITMITTSVLGCGSGEAQTKAPSETTSVEETAADPAKEEEAIEEPLDLTGLWIQEDKAESYMAATIQEDGRIGVFWVLEGDETPYTYWVGTYDAPTEATDKYEWTSQSTYGGNGILASSDDSKKFTYANDRLTYTVTIQGESKEAVLVRGDWDVSAIPDNAFGSVKMETSDFKELEIKDSGWFVNKNGYLYYYVTLYNPNEDIAVEFPSFRVTARDENNALIDTTDQTLSMIYPGEEFTYGSQAFSVEEAAPSTVDFETLEVEEYNLKNAGSLDEFKQLTVENTAVRGDKIVGEIKNSNDYSIDSVYVLAICRDSNNEVAAIEFTFVDDVAANGNTPFSISSYSDAEIESAEFYAYPW